MQKTLKIQEIVFKEEKEPQHFCESFIYEPANLEEEKLGSLFLAGEVTNFHKDARYFLNYFASLIRREYFADTRRQPNQALETALKKANTVLEQINQKEGMDLNNKIRFLAAAVNNQNLYISQMGRIYALLLRSNQIFDLSKKILLLKNGTPDDFSHTLNGHIYLGDRIIIATQNFFRLCSLREFKQIFETQTLAEVTRDLEVILNGPTQLNLATILIEVAAGSPPPKQKVAPKRKNPDALTLEEIFEKAEKKEPVNKVITVFEETPLSGKLEEIPKREIGISRPSSAGKINLVVARFSNRLSRLKLPPVSYLTSFKRLLFMTKNAARPSMRRKIYLGASLTLAVALTAIAIGQVFRKERVVKIENCNFLIMEAQKKVETADNDLILKNKDSALKNLADAQRLVSQILRSEQTSPPMIDEAVNLATEIKQKIIKIQAAPPKKSNKK